MVVATLIKVLLQPVLSMWHFMGALLLLCVCFNIAHVSQFSIKYSLSEFYAIALVLSFLKGKWRTALTAIVFILLAMIVTIEAFLHYHFNLNFMCDALNLLFETTPTEASQFLDTFVYQWATLKFLIAFVASIVAFVVLNRIRARLNYTQCSTVVSCVLLGAVVGLFATSGWVKQQCRFLYLLGSKNVYDFELRYIQGEEAGGSGTNTSLARLIAGARLYYLTTLQCDEIIETARTATVDGCSFSSPGIILFIGESAIRSHYQAYGYRLPTTPRLMQELQCNNICLIDSAYTIATQTSEVFKQMLSLHNSDQPGTWTSAPMLPHLMRLAHYRVSMVSNQFSNDTHSMWNNMGSFFLRNPQVSSLLLDYQSSTIYQYDEGLLIELDRSMLPSTPNFMIFHVRGQHVAFSEGYPPNRAHFTVADYAHRNDLTPAQRQVVAHYDNCTLYQDSITGALFDRYRDQDVVIVFVSDHGENVYDDGKTLGRVHNDFSPAMYESQYHVPMWIWTSPVYQEKHPAMTARIRQASHRKFKTDDMPHLILDLAGINCPYFTPNHSPLN